MRRPLTLLALLATVATAASGVLVRTAAAAGQSPAIADCNSHGRLTRHYSAAQLRVALSTMPADVKEYTDCYDVLHRALLIQIGSPHDGGLGGTGAKSGGSGGSFLPTPLIVVLALLALSAAAFGVIAIRRRWTGDTPTGS